MTSAAALRCSGLGAHRWALVAAGMFAVAWGGNQFTPLLVMYRLQHGFSAFTVYVFLFAYVIGIVPALLIGGLLSDRVGRRSVMLLAPAIAAVGSILIAVGADLFWLLLAGRVFAGIALGIGMAVGGSWVTLDESLHRQLELLAGAGVGKR